MRNEGHTAIKAIIGMGVLVFVFLMLTSVALKRAMLKQGQTRVVLPVERLSPFDIDRAEDDLEAIVGFGPRDPGSQGIDSLRGYLRRELAAAGFEVAERSFSADTVAGTVPMLNLSVTIPGDQPGSLALCTHYDTKRVAEIEFLGANSGGSGTAWLLEMARALGPAQRQGVSIDFVWLDGEEALTEGDAGGHGAKVLAEALRDVPAAVIYLDMIGDCLLRIGEDRDAPEMLRDAVWNTADRLRYRRQFGKTASATPGAHRVLREAGIPALGLVDFSYGGTAIQHEKYYHTSLDTLDMVCAESLRAVADVIYHSLPTIDRDLQKLISVTG